MLKNTLKISTPISPYSENDEYPTHFSKYGKGGYKEVDTIEERDAIPMNRRSIGMIVCVQNPKQKWYVLQNGLENLNYVDFTTIINDESNLFVIGETEPKNPTNKTVWLVPSTGVLYYRDETNTSWIKIVFDVNEIDGGWF